MKHQVLRDIESWLEKRLPLSLTLSREGEREI
jgi:hypothetical protein